MQILKPPAVGKQLFKPGVQVYKVEKAHFHLTPLRLSLLREEVKHLLPTAWNNFSMCMGWLQYSQFKKLIGLSDAYL